MVGVVVAVLGDSCLCREAQLMKRLSAHTVSLPPEINIHRVVKGARGGVRFSEGGNTRRSSGVARIAAWLHGWHTKISSLNTPLRPWSQDDGVTLTDFGNPQTFHLKSKCFYSFF